MKERIYIGELADGVARRATIPVSFAEHFVKGFFDTIKDALMRDKLVKVKGLGTFKLVDVDERESVDVNTGERIMLSAHAKVTFTPDNTLRDTINRPFADFETVVLNDDTPTELMDTGESEESEPLQKAAQKSPDTKEDVNEKTSKATTVEPSTRDDSDVNAEVADESNPVAGAESPADTKADALAELHTGLASANKSETDTETDAVQTSVEEVVEATKPAASTDVKDETSEKTKKEVISTEPTKANNTMSTIIKNILAALLCLFIGYAVCYYFRPFELPTLSPASKAEAPEMIVPSDETKAPAEQTDASSTTADTDEDKPEEVNNYPQLDGGEYEIVGVKGTETMSPGKTLLNISLKYYKSTDFVPYICAMNGIENPDIVPLGKELQIPELRKK